uniref:hypothetical protein n=1 Tax=Bacillus cytotoxicus TaxID=580165 RepID=UPI00203E8EAE
MKLNIKREIRHVQLGYVGYNVFNLIKNSKIYHILGEDLLAQAQTVGGGSSIIIEKKGLQ